MFCAYGLKPHILVLGKKNTFVILSYYVYSRERSSLLECRSSIPSNRVYREDDNVISTFHLSLGLGFLIDFLDAIAIPHLLAVRYIFSAAIGGKA